MEDTATSAAPTPHPRSADYSGLSELSYRRATDANTSHIDRIEGVSALDPLESPSLMEAAEAWQPGAGVAAFIQHEYGLTVDPVDRGDGLTHFYSQSGFSGFLTVRDAGTESTSDDEVIITYRGTDLADNAEGGMIGDIQVAARPLVKAAALGRGAQPSFEEYQTAVEEITDAPFREFSVQRDAQGRVTERLVDAGDIYTNGMLGQGTYHATQYDDAEALFRLASQHFGDGGQTQATAGQSLGGGLAGLVAVDNGVVGHTFGMAPFRNQMDVLAQRRAVRSMLEDESHAEAFGDLATRYGAADTTTAERISLERELSESFSDLRTDTGGHSGKAATSAIRRFNAATGADIDRDTLREFNRLSDVNESVLEANTGRLEASTVAGEFTTNSGEGSTLGYALTLGSEQIIPTNRLHTYDVGPDQTDSQVRDIRNRILDGDRDLGYQGQDQTLGVRFLGEGLSTHSPALHDLVTVSQSSPAGSFDDLLADNSNLRYSVLHRPGLMGGVISGKVGANDDPSASRSEAVTNETVYRALSGSIRYDGSYYEDRHFMLSTMATQGRASEGADAANPDEATLNGALTQFALQDIRVDVAGMEPREVKLAVEPAETYASNIQAGLIGFDLQHLEAEATDMNRETDAQGNPIAGMGGVFGHNDLQRVIYTTVRDQLDVPGDKPWLESDLKAVSGIADSITGVEQEFRSVDQSEGRFDVSSGRMDVGYVYAQTGAPVEGAQGQAWQYSSETLEALQPGKGIAMFLGEDSNYLEGSYAHDYAMMGGGNDIYESVVAGGAVVSGNTGFDTYVVDDSVGPVFMTMAGSASYVARQSAESFTGEAFYGAVDRTVGVERFVLGQGNDAISVTSLSGDRILDGGAGVNSVDYTELDRSFELDVSDGVTASGTVYSARLSDGDSTLYIINVDDAAIRRGDQATGLGSDIPKLGMVAEEGVAQEWSTVATPLREVVAQMHADTAEVYGDISARAVTDELSPEDMRMGRLLAESGLPEMFSTLHGMGTTHLDLPTDAASTPSARIVTSAQAAATALTARSADLPPSEYNPELDPAVVTRAADVLSAQERPVNGLDIDAGYEAGVS